ncbi:MAG: type II secretion system F family protein [Gammaproteobacteria bacterium]|nr:type II secretion system F family protein [Gammaproteobacteria bacterium]HXK55206.1 type II secretion system F family protein [Gammaproteobacteria bacterium]
MAVAAPKAEKANIFAWEGSDRRGKRLKGETRAANVALVRADLRRQGINPIKVTKKSTLFTTRKKKIRPGDIAVFSRQLATMMSSGVPLVQAFDIVGRGHDNPSMQDLILSIKADVEGGTALAEALKKHPLYFDDLFCNLVHAGEQAGVLEELLHKIATYKEKTESLKGKIKKAMFYPAAVIIVAVLVTSIIMIFVIPQFQELFSSFGSDLPAFTQVVVAMSEWMQQWWWLLLLIVIATVYIFGYIWKRSRKFRHTVDKILLKTPIIGVIVNKAALARFARTLSTMFAAGVPLVEALESVSGATGNVVYGEAVLRMREDVATGQSLQLAMKQQNLFPHMVIQMVAIGEESGSIDGMLAKVADFFEEEVDNAVDALSSLLEPLIMVILGTLIGGLVIAMYLPIFQMGSAVMGK